MLLLFISPVMSDSLWPWHSCLQHARTPCPSPSPEVYRSSRLLHQWCTAISFSDSFCLQSFPASGTLPMSQLFTSDNQRSFSIHPSNECSGLISSKMDWFDLHTVQVLSGVFSGTTVQKHQFFGALPSFYSLTLTTVHDHWEDESLDCTDFCRQSDVSVLQHTV